MKLAIACTIAFAIATTACESIDEADFPIDVCNEPLLGSLDLPSAVDYLELRGNGGTIASVGERCASASDRARCDAQVSAAAPSAGGIVASVAPGLAPPDTEYFVSVRGDDIDVVDTDAELLALLGPISTATEARLLAWVHGFQPSCRLRAVADGFEAYAQRAESCGQRDALVVRIASNGDLAEVDRDVVQAANGCAR